MAIKIHHGPNGSYKTSGAVWDDAVPAAKAGRLIITNIRGMSTERFQKLFPDLPDTFELEYINHETQAGMDRIRTWFQWAPRNAFLMFDEAQTLFPKKWNDKFLEKFDYPGGMDAANAADRPMNFLDAWTRHRHWNWDVILTTPNIKYVHEEIRNTSEAAYQHSNLMLLGKYLKKLVGKDYKEAMHSAQENRAPTDGSNIVNLRKIDKRVFQLYDSTATGQHRDTMAGKNALLSPRVVMLLGAILVIFGVVYYRHGSAGFTNPLSPPKHEASATAGSKGTPVPSPQNPIPASGVGTPSVPSEQVAPVVPVTNDPFASYEISVAGSIYSETKGIIFLFTIAKDGHKFNMSHRDLVATGYQIFAHGSCVADLVYQGQKRTVACLGPGTGGGGEERLGAERRAAAASSNSARSPVAQTPAVTQMPAQEAIASAGFTVVTDSTHPARTIPVN